MRSRWVLISWRSKIQVRKSQIVTTAKVFNRLSRNLSRIFSKSNWKTRNHQSKMTHRINWTLYQKIKYRGNYEEENHRHRNFQSQKRVQALIQILLKIAQTQVMIAIAALHQTPLIPVKILRAQLMTQNMTTKYLECHRRHHSCHLSPRICQAKANCLKHRKTKHHS